MARKAVIPTDEVHRESLEIALDVFVRAGRLRRVVTVNELFDALAARWSATFQHVRTASGARTILDMFPSTVKAVRTDLLRVGIHFDKVWKCAIGPTPLYTTEYLKFPGYAGYQVFLSKQGAPGSPVTPSSSGRRLLHFTDPTPVARCKHEIAGERPFNEIVVGPRAAAVCRIQEHMGMRFDVVAFLEDYSCAERAVADHEAIVAFPEWGDLPNLLRYSSAPISAADRSSARDIEAKHRIADRDARRDIRALFDTYDVARRIVDDFGGVAQQARELLATADMADVIPGHPLVEGRYIYIRSAFDLQISHRYQWQHFWPPSVSAQKGRVDVVHGRVVESSQRGRWFEFPEPVTSEGPFANHGLVGMDISSSQTQILAALLGIPDLENRAAQGSFKKYLAGEAWRQHRDLLRDGYTGADDPRLEDLVKELWLRRLYGGVVYSVVMDCWSDRDTYGPGWRSVVSATAFLDGIVWYADVVKFLSACEHIADLAGEYDGVVFTDPLDGVAIRWNPIERTTAYVAVDDQKLTVRPPGRDGVVAKPNDAGDYPVDKDDLRTMIAPCVTHMVDGYFSSLVIERLYARRVGNFLAVHDCWLVPCDLDTLTDVLGDASAEWFKGLGPVYDRLAHYLGDDPDYGAFVHEIRAKWTDRVKRKAWPKFRAVRTAPTDVIDQEAATVAAS